MAFENYANNIDDIYYLIGSAVGPHPYPQMVRFFQSVIGNEANGVSKDIQDISDIKVKIPMPGKAESLNASVAAGLMIYEYVRESYNK